MTRHIARARDIARAEHGFGAVSLLATLAILAAIIALAVPALKGSGQSAAGTQYAGDTAAAQDAQAKSLAQIAQTAMATYAAGGQSGYANVSPDALHAIEPQLGTAATSGPYVASASGTSDGYAVVIADPATHNTFTLTDTGGVTVHSCTTAGNGGCPAGGRW
jgi:hypothetical protein